MDTATQPSYESIAEFYSGKSVFITGGTGFLGKAFIEKLLYSCKDIGNIYILIRNKKGENGQKRIEELIEKPPFSRLKRERPQDLKKFVPILGDIQQPGFGISPEDEETLLEKVSVVFHVAATVKFNEDLKVALETNVGGTQYILSLCHRMKNIKAFVHISTAYCNSNKTIIEEKIYPPPAELDEVYKIIEQPNHDEKQIKNLLKGLPNNYTFTKALAETIVDKNHGNIPSVIIRPSIVSASLREPCEGWVDNWFGATGIIAATRQGANKVVFSSPNNVLDLIPVDYVTNLTIVAAARCASSTDVSVYNHCTGSCNPLTCIQVYRTVKEEAKGDNAYVYMIFTTNKWLLSILTFLFQTLPAYLADLYLQVRGKQPKYMKIQSKVVAGRNVLNYFTSHSWDIRANRARALHASLSAEDRRTFPCDPTDIDWDNYIRTYVEGIKRYLMPQ